MQDYPIKDMEIILADGGSTDRTKEIISSYQTNHPKLIKLIHNPKKVSIGKGNGMDMATRLAKGEIIILLDQDNILVQKNWISRAVEMLENNPKITAVQSRLFSSKNSSLTDKYLNSLGIEDYSLNAQITLNPEKFFYDRKDDCFIYQINKKRFFYAGDNGFIIRRKEFLETGGYTQDIENFYRMANSGKNYFIAVPKNLVLHHKTSTTFKHMLAKRVFYVRHYLMKNYENRDFYWFDLKKNTLSQNARFLRATFYNLLIIPNLVSSFKIALKRREGFWFIHPIASFAITLQKL